jgi:hypothetical protein
LAPYSSPLCLSYAPTTSTHDKQLISKGSNYISAAEATDSRCEMHHRLLNSAYRSAQRRSRPSVDCDGLSCRLRPTRSACYRLGMENVIECSGRIFVALRKAAGRPAVGGTYSLSRRHAVLSHRAVLDRTRPFLQMGGTTCRGGDLRRMPAAPVQIARDETSLAGSPPLHH